MIGLMPCSHGPSYVPSDVVQCHFCGCDCWISKATGPELIEAATAAGDGRFACMPCLLMQALANPN